MHLTLDGINGKWRWRRNSCQIEGENSKLRRQSSEFSDGNAVFYDCYLRCHFWMTPYVHNTGINTATYSCTGPNLLIEHELKFETQAWTCWCTFALLRFTKGAFYTWHPQQINDTQIIKNIVVQLTQKIKYALLRFVKGALLTWYRRNQWHSDND